MALSNCDVLFLLFVWLSLSSVNRPDRSQPPRILLHRSPRLLQKDVHRQARRFTAARSPGRRPAATGTRTWLGRVASPTRRHHLHHKPSRRRQVRYSKSCGVISLLCCPQLHGGRKLNETYHLPPSYIFGRSFDLAFPWAQKTQLKLYMDLAKGKVKRKTFKSIL